MESIAIRETAISGLLEVDLVVNRDSRGSFKEGWQLQKFAEAGFPAFTPVQHNVAVSTQEGTTRGIHGEPWNKLISVVNGSVFAAIVDLRKGPENAQVETFTLDESKALFVPRGCANSYQTLCDNVAYSYLVDAHWSPQADYTFVNLADLSLNIRWPIPLEDAVISDKDLRAPYLKDLS